jgi:hypothetical protein
MTDFLKRREFLGVLGGAIVGLFGVASATRVVTIAATTPSLDAAAFALGSLAEKASRASVGLGGTLGTFPTSRGIDTDVIIRNAMEERIFRTARRPVNLISAPGDKP